MQLLLEGDTPTTPTTRANVDAWVTSFKVPFTTGMDLVAGSRAIKKTLGIKETAYIVDRPTMKILVKTSTPEDAYAALSTLP